MNDIRARFEEIWPVPDGVYWSPVFGTYVCAHGSPVKLECMDLNLRLDTFTRCQETTDVYVSLVDEMLMEIEGLAIAAYGCVPQQSQDILDRAKQIMGNKQ